MRRFVVAAAIVLAACNRLPRSLRDEIEAENGRLRDAHRQLDRGRDAVRAVVPAQTEWNNRLRADDDKLAWAERNEKELAREDSEQRAQRLLADARRLRMAAVDDAHAVETQALHWLDVQRNLPRYLEKAQKSADLTGLETTIQKAGRDWPAKKSDLDSRLAALKQTRQTAQAKLGASESARVAAVMEMESADPVALEAMAGQLYDSWDKVLEDLDQNHDVYREKLKIVRTRFTDVAEKKTETSSGEKWEEVPEASWRAVEKDLGMAISHKDAGLYDSEAKTIAQPPGYAYIAPPSVGSNQYGYWTHNSGGSFWTFLPQYLIMRELLWGRSYQPVVINEYNHYYEAQRSGRSYYGVETPNAAPKYGTHGTFTQQRYSGSRYVQSGGFSSSGYASRPRDNVAPQFKRFGGGPSGPEPSAGKRFGSGSSGGGFRSEPSGRRFGSPSSGRRFGGGSRRR